MRAAADVFLGSLGNPNTVRAYGIGIGKTAERVGEARPLASVADEEIGEALELLWGSAAVGPWLAWCRERGAQRSGRSGLDQAAAGAGFGDSGPVADGDRPADRPA